MSERDLAVLLVEMVRDWLHNKSDGWFRLGGLLEAQEIEIPDGKPWAEFEARVYAQLDRWEYQAKRGGGVRR